MDETISILVVDDEPVTLFATARLLRSAGYPVLEADSGAGCLNLAREKKPDLILLDVQLPDMLGYEVCRQIKADAELRQSYVVLLSGVMTSSDNQSEGLEIGADGYLTRPIANRELLARVQAMVRIITAERERDLLIKKLQEALATIKTLSGMLPICSSCKKIRDDQGYWEEVELYVKKHSTAEFTHGICPACFKRLYGDINIEEE
jgi:DNA-binding response OmpR family regulator